MDRSLGSGTSHGGCVQVDDPSEAGAISLNPGKKAGPGVSRVGMVGVVRCLELNTQFLRFIPVPRKSFSLLKRQGSSCIVSLDNR